MIPSRATDKSRFKHLTQYPQCTKKQLIWMNLKVLTLKWPQCGM